jgi:hypothetical protein
MISSKRASFWSWVGGKLERGWNKILDWDMYHTRFVLWRLDHLNRTSKLPVTDSRGPVVSLTSYGKRTDTVYLTLESIAAGSLRPSRLILWLDDNDIFSDLPESLKRLQERGAEIYISENYGPHEKYYPYVASNGNFSVPLVTADDDTVYPRYWLDQLYRAYRKCPDVVHCFCARVVAFQNGVIVRYADWKYCSSPEPSSLHFATGVSGVIYPPRLLEHLKQAGLAFLQCCPKADDIWLHAVTIRAGYKIQLIRKRSRHFTIIPGTQTTSLNRSNFIDGDGNDRQISATYTVDDLHLLQ